MCLRPSKLEKKLHWRKRRQELAREKACVVWEGEICVDYMSLTLNAWVLAALQCLARKNVVSELRIWLQTLDREDFICFLSSQIVSNYLFCPLTAKFCFLTGYEWLLESPVVTGDIVDLSKPLSISAKLPAVIKDSNSNPSLTVGVWVYYCMETGKACMMKAASFTQPLQICDNPGEEEVTVALAHAF